MKNFPFIICLLLTFLLASTGFSQSINFEDGFEDGDFADDPTWSGETDQFTVIDGDPNSLLQLTADSDASPAYISAPLEGITGTWEFYVEYRDNSYSSSNQVTVFLMSDTDDLEGSVNGYAIQVGESGDDYFELARYDNGTETTLLTGNTVVEDDDGYKVLVTRDNNGSWEMQVAKGYSGTYNSAVTTTDNNYTNGSYLGPRINFSSTRNESFYFDFKIDLPPFTITESTAEGNQVDVTFNRPYDKNTVSKDDFSVDGLGEPSTISYTDETTITLNYDNPIPSGKYALTVIDNIDDVNGETIADNTTSSFVIFAKYSDGDLIINEFTYDYPTTINEEYIELKNTSDKYLNLANWEIADNNSSSSLGSDPIPIEPNSFLVISADTTGLYNIFEDRAYYEISFPALNNTTPDAVQLITEDGSLADSLTYNSNWGGTDVALERRSASAPSTFQENWADSPNPDGGTPGAPNEIGQDDTSPRLTEINISSSQTITLTADERLDSNSATEVANYDLTNATIKTVSFSSPNNITLNLEAALQNAEGYDLAISNLEDIFGNAATAIDTSFTYYEVSEADSGDIAINEFMFVPTSNSSEYVELYNHSDKSFDLQGWTLSDNRDQQAVITSSSVIVPPDSIVIIAPDNTLLTDFPGISIVTMNSFPALNNGRDQIIIRNSSGIKLDSLAYQSSWGGDEVALERRSIVVPATYPSNWGNASNGFGTPGSVNEIEPDSQPPALESFTIDNRNELTLVFSESITKSSGEDITNYSFSKEPNISTASFSAPDRISLILDSDMHNATSYNLSIENISDIFGNQINPVDTTFTFYRISPVNSGDVFINEFSHIPPSENTEFVEIYNSTSKSFNLQGWTLSDNRENPNIISQSQFIVPPDSFVVIAPDNTLLSQFPDISLVSMNNFPALNNGSDAIILYDDNGNQLDSLKYTPQWGNSEGSLERRSTSISGIYQENWGLSPNPNGTPGTANKIGSDTDPPRLTSFTISSKKQLKLGFSEQLRSSSASDLVNYDISNTAVSEISIPHADSVIIELDPALKNAQNYTLSVSNIEDLFANALIQTDTTFTYYEVSEADSGDVFVNEFMYDPPSGSAEYVELYNATEKSLDLQGWTISDNTGSRQIITESQFVIPPDSFAVIAADRSLLNEDPDIAVLAMGNNFPTLNNSGDDIVIHDESGVQMDSLQYTSDWGGSEVALERRSTTVSAFYQSNWGEMGSPGNANKIPQDETPPDLLSFEILTATKLQLTFNEAMNPTSLETPEIYALSEGIDIDQTTAAGVEMVTLSLSSDLQNATDYLLTIDGAEDIFGNSLSGRDTTFTYYAVSEADSGDVFVNEFMSIPPSGQTEYIELYNPTSQSFNLQDWTVNDNTGNPQTISENRFILPPDNFIVITPDNTLENNFPNIAVVEMGNRFPSLNNSGDDIVIRNESGILLDSLQYSSTWGGDEVAVERRSIDISGTYESNWSDSPNGFGTPGSPNEVAPDTEPPGVESFSILGNNKMLLTFSEPLDSSTAGNSANYALISNINIANANFSAPDSVFLSLNENLQNSTKYNLAIQNITDLFGNTASAIDTVFTYYEISPVEPRDIFITEFNFIPPSGSTEYVEIYNPTPKSFSLQDWTLSDNRNIEATITGSQFIVPPESYVVIAPDNTLLSDFPDIRLLTMSNFPALNNSSDDIIIRKEDGTLLDSLQYTSKWGGDEVALERRTTYVSGAYQENWGDAPNEFGTPGAENEIAVDETPPTFEEFLTKDPATLTLLFSEKLKSSSATAIENYKIIPNRGIQLVSVQDNAVTLFLNEDLNSGETYEVTVSNISDIFDNTLDDASKEVEFLRINEAKYADIVINEILYNPDTGGADFVELYNTSDKNFNLNNWIIGDSSYETSISQNIKLRANSYLVLTGNSTLAQQSPNTFDISGFPALNNNTPDDIYLQTENKYTVDSLRYHQSWGGSEDGSSLERKDPKAASNDASNWQTSADNGSSIGEQNINFQEDNLPPEVLFSKVRTNGNIEVRFNEFIRLTDDVRFLADRQPLQVAAFDSTNGNFIVLQDAEAKLKGNSNATITAENLTDVKGNTTSSSEISVAQPLQSADLVINEIMYNPLREPDDNQPDQSEYIELRNTSDYPLSLEGLYLHDAPDEDGNLRDLHPVNSTAKWVSPQGQVLIYADGATNFKESQVANFFDIEPAQSSSVMRIDRTTLSLASSDDAIYVADSTGAAIDSVYFDDSWQNPNVIDTRGIALERISPNGSSNDDSNWGSSVNPKGGTPHSENSIYQEQNESPTETGISFTPNPFTPDDDGHNDNLFINYILEQQDYLIKVHIYDRYGRLVRELADGEQAGLEGQLIWDGRKDDQSRNRIGIYIVVFEAYDSSSGSDKAYKKTVVLARQLH